MKKFIINVSLIGLGIAGTIGFQMYFPCSDEQATCTSDSTKVDSTVVPEVSPAVTTQDTAKKDSIK